MGNEDPRCGVTMLLCKMLCLVNSRGRDGHNSDRWNGSQCIGKVGGYTSGSKNTPAHDKEDEEGEEVPLSIVGVEL